MSRPTRAELEQRVDELAQELSGREFAQAVQAYFDGLDPESQEALREILVERAANLDLAVMERVDARGWFRRQWDKASGEGAAR
jgi:hypothetical protein